jgi:hypothetical protein
MGVDRLSGRRTHIGWRNSYGPNLSWPKHRVLGNTVFNRMDSCIFSSRVLRLILRDKLMDTKDVDFALMDPIFTKALMQFLTL